ncbi:hypothetical protein [Fulvimarina sp. MAC8]|uniref:hypothetical protein n=1 Tax=Fulvimarina sp. MAC8 TaxID=3162874 RepID=UPI0032EDF985
MTQHIGDLVVSGEIEQSGQVTGTTYVRSGGRIVAHGQLLGGLVIEKGGAAILHGQSARNVVNHGHLLLFGQIAGQLIGSSPLNSLERGQIMGRDLELPAGMHQTA